MEASNSSFRPNDLASSSGDTEEIIRLLNIQNQLLRELTHNFTKNLESNDDERYSVRTRILDINMSIGSMIAFMFKWLIASIPVAILIGVVYVFFFIIILGAAR